MVEPCKWCRAGRAGGANTYRVSMGCACTQRSVETVKRNLSATRTSRSFRCNNNGTTIFKKASFTSALKLLNVTLVGKPSMPVACRHQRKRKKKRSGLAQLQFGFGGAHLRTHPFIFYQVPQPSSHKITLLLRLKEIATALLLEPRLNHVLNHLGIERVR